MRGNNWKIHKFLETKKHIKKNNGSKMKSQEKSQNT